MLVVFSHFVYFLLAGQIKSVVERNFSLFKNEPVSTTIEVNAIMVPVVLPLLRGTLGIH